MSVILKPSVANPQVEVSIITTYNTPEGLRRLANAIEAAALWLAKAKARK